MQKDVKTLFIKIVASLLAPAVPCPQSPNVESGWCSEGAAQRRPTLTGPDGLGRHQSNHDSKGEGLKIAPLSKGSTK